MSVGFKNWYFGRIYYVTSCKEHFFNLWAILNVINPIPPGLKYDKFLPGGGSMPPLYLAKKNIGRFKIDGFY